MTKQDLLTDVEELELDNEMEKAIKQMIADSEEITPDLLNAIAEILENQAKADEEVEGLYTSAARRLEILNENLSTLGTNSQIKVGDRVISIDELLSEDFTLDSGDQSQPVIPQASMSF